jgi:hypothetical protein
MSAKRVLSTWIVLDGAENASNYPQAGRLQSSDPRIHALYWRCVASFFAVAKCVGGEGLSFRLYTNSSGNMTKALPQVIELLSQAGVEIVGVPIKHVPPVGYYGRWRNQFYIIDIMASIAKETENASYLILDSDCLCLRPLAEVFALIEQKGAITMLTGEKPDAYINGLTREQMKTVFEEIGNTQLSLLPKYSGGELFAANLDTIRRMLPIAEDAWQSSLERHSSGKLKLNEEAHLLSFVYYMLGIEPGLANQFIKRLWTGIHFRNGQPDDSRLPIIHLPAEKRFGYVDLFKVITDSSSWFYREKDAVRWRHRLQRTMSIPRPSFLKMVREIGTYGIVRMRNMAKM